MKQKELTGAYSALKEIAGVKLPAATAYAVLLAIRKMEAPYQCGVEAMRAAIERHHGAIRDDGTILFPTADESRKCYAELTELDETDVVGVELSPIRIDIRSIDGGISPATMLALDGFVSFYETAEGE